MRRRDPDTLPHLAVPPALTLDRLRREVPFSERWLAFECFAFVPLLDRDVRLQYAPDDSLETAEEWTPYGAEALQSVLEVPTTSRGHLQALLLESYRFHASVTDYGVDGDPDDPFGISTGEEAEREAGEPWVYVTDPFVTDPEGALVAMIGYYPVWEDEHGIYVVIQDRRIVGLASDPYDHSALDRSGEGTI